MNADIEHGLTAATFEQSLGSCFVLLINDSDSVDLELVEVKRLKSNEHSTKREPFSLLFRGPVGFCHPQGLYELKHDELGVFTTFLVPMAPDKQASYFESIFN